ncbi:hypothetical protein V8D89_009274 [Ganoderma adspersum]
MSSDNPAKEGLSDPESKAPPAPKKNSGWDKLPPWIANNLRSKKSWKVLFRCWLASWACFVIMLPMKSLEQLGNTAFFAFLLSLMMPPNMPVQIFLMVMLTLVLGIALGWALSCAAMAAALAARNQTLLKATLQKQVQSAAGLANPDALFRNAIFDGAFLDTGSTVVFGVFLAFGTFVFALIRAYAPRLTLMSVFGTIAIDIFCSYGPLFPFAQYTLLNSMLTSVGCYIAIALILVTIVFPESLNHSYLDSSSALLQTLKGLLASQEEILRADPHDVLPGTPLIGKVFGMRVGAIQLLQQLMSQKQMLDFEFSWGRWCAEDVEGMLEPMQIVVTRLGALVNFIKLMALPMSLSDAASGDTQSVGDESTAFSTAIGDTYLLRQFRERNNAAETQYHVRLVDVLPNLREATAGVRAAGVEVLDAIQKLIVSVNTKRYTRGHVEQDVLLLQLEKSLTGLRDALEDFKNDQRFVLLQPFRDLLDRAHAGEMKSIPLRSLHMSFVFTSNLVSTSSAIVTLAEYVSKTAAKRPKTRLWLPTGLRAIGKALMSRGSGGEAVGEDTAPKEEIEMHNTRKYKRDPDSKAPENGMQKIANVIHKVYLWTKTPEALFTFRYVLITIALWIPQVVKGTAGFVYAERGLWALIMAQTTLNIYASDQIFNYVMRLAGTFLGALVGMVCWYIGAGHGNGNPYGLAAINGVILVPFVFIRIFAPPQYLSAVAMGGATFVLVVGYSWIDGNLPGVFKNVGLAWSVAWKRWVLVMIGSAASFILMMIPPKSGRKAVRLRNASVISGLSYLYSHLTSLWLAAGEPFDSLHTLEETPRRWPSELREMVVTFSQQIQDLRMRTVMSKWEGNIRGHWPFEEYNQILDLQVDILSSLVLMASGLTNMDPTLRKASLPHTFVLNPHFISDAVSMFYLVSQSLRTGEPLHAAQYKNLSDRLFYHSTTSTIAVTDADVHNQSEKAHRQSIMSYEYMFYSSAVVAVLHMCHSLNELRTVVAGLCGEVPLEGFEHWREEYDRSHAPV